ncbi:MAG: transporter substrate-binding domain-containing protein [Geitlerinemataceae cyanobacterium]
MSIPMLPSRFSVPKFCQRLCLGSIFGFIFAGAQLWCLPVCLPAWAGSLAEIEARGQLVVAVKDNWRPMGFRTDAGQLRGLEISLARRLAEELLGDPEAVVFQPVSNQLRLRVVMDGEVDLAIAGVTATESRARVVSFSSPYYLDGVTFVTSDAALQNLENLANRTVALLDGSSTLAAMRYFLPEAQLVGVESYPAAIALLEAGEADVFAADASILAGWVQEFPRYRLLPFQLSVEPLCVVMPKGLQYDELRRRVQGAIDGWEAEGWLREQAAYWGLPIPSDSSIVN